jgi:shikimate kinase
LPVKDEAVAAEIASLARSNHFGRPIALTGFMGAGKTTVGRLLADVLERPFYDTDSYVEDVSSRSVDDFFLSQQEAEFRQRESAAVADLLAKGAIVIALGGGALLNEASRSSLVQRSLLVHLYVPWKEMRERVPALIATRPLLRGKSMAEIHRLYLQRMATYRSAALRVTVGRRSTAEAAAEVLLALRKMDSQRKADPRLTASRTAAVLEALAGAKAKPVLDLERTV